uniref:Uncharacterized protein n=1 Tax=viral metagenome TaxID=1070528 RepID=A0A6C0J299_9ZZZZ
MLLLVNGNNSLDIFKALVQILESKCFELFGKTMILSRSRLEKDVEPLKEFFYNLGIILCIEFTDDINMKEYSNNCILKDYKLWIEMPCRTNLAISFDYACHNSKPRHLE